MNFTMNFSGLEDIVAAKMEQLEDRVALQVEPEVQRHRCQEKTRRVSDYRLQKIKHLKWFERLTYLFYKKRLCPLGMRQEAR